ncbi:DUF421 domain-containing protein [Fredinandcohnia quinoae]|uniref:DUF421 domain-containing protein n=1 Tax=Fredinandcohnia quinoae TaxID=2918902 RepID=A0AAW5DXC6_9BACI|nr:DUF421 domain-containing protein [Fredinandcohnia sp. SECRCQ15]MCH1625305.1 DUF421 domain-containing protein [Fredinandcohnia sp. SECRCQ15]
MKLSYLTVELIVGFFLLFVIVKILGKKIINQVTPFTFIASIVLGELLGNALYDDKVSITHIIYSVTLWGLLLFTVEILGQKFLKLRLIFEGKPSVLIRNGVVNRDQLKKNHMNLNQLQSLLRQSETFSIREVAYCYLEANGSLSILKKSPKQKAQQEDLNLPPKSVYVPVTIIRDGELLKDELVELGRDEEWLTLQLQAKGVADYRNVFIAEWLEGDGLFVQTFKQVTT